MQVQAVRPGHATVSRGEERRQVRTALVDPVGQGDWLLVFLDDARERLSPERAAEIEATLLLVEAALAGTSQAPGEAAFELPSASWTPEQLEALT
jgi:hydrogenase expression/formation protein HypC